MRPLELELEGFTAFRDRTIVDFRGVDLFALSGPTGAGKTSVIDAITFALYGAVARHREQRLTAEVISQGEVEARVRLDFTIGPDTYRAARTVRATSESVAVTHEARLERLGPNGEGDECLADGADATSESVCTLLGLTFEHFNTCVVLPQGEFARFLHAEPAVRQGLLVELLGLGVYDRIRELAEARSRAAKVEVEATERQLADLPHATPEARRDLDRRLGLLGKLTSRIEEAQPTLDGLEADAVRSRDEAAGAAARSALVAGLAVPADAEAVGRKLAAATHESNEQTALAEVAALALEQATAAFDDGVDRVGLEVAVRDHDAREKVASRLLALEAEQVATRTAEGEAREALARSADALEVATRQDLAQALLVDLAVGEPCPVCDQQVLALPEHRPTDLAGTAAARERAVAASAEASADHADKIRALDRTEVILAEIRGQLADLDEALVGRPPIAVARAQLSAHVRAERDLANARSADGEARDRQTKASQILAGLQQNERDLRRRFDEQRDALAALTPPVAVGDSLADDWRDLVAWASGQHPELDDQVSAANERALGADKERAELVERIDEFCRGVDIDLAGREPLVAAVEERARVESRLRELDEALGRRTTLEATRAEAVQMVRVAGSLATHLRPDHFERWVLDEALDRLVSAATARLAELAGGAYSLAVDEHRNFAVIDHAKSGAVRSARTLSGGETFLVSLALALALADQIAGLATGGTVELESLFLDEGFASLDPGTLDAVAAAIETLGAQGRMVGVVTHVPGLADRLPVRFEVRKGPSTSTIDRIVD